MLCWELSRKLFEFAKVAVLYSFNQFYIFETVLRKLDIGLICESFCMHTYCTTCKGLPRPAPGAQAVEGYGEFQCGSGSIHCAVLRTFTFPFIGTCRASKGDYGAIFAKVPRRLCEGTGESQSAF